MIPVGTRGQPAEWEGLEAEELVHALVRVQEYGPALYRATRLRQTIASCK